jgi:TolA-binding protein
MIKQASLAAFLVVCAGAIGAQPPDPCAGQVGDALSLCRDNQQRLQQQQIELLQQQFQQQQDRQKHLNEQQRQIRDQLENMRLQNETLRQQLEHEKSANQPAKPPATDYSKSPESKSWGLENPWYWSDYANTEFAMRYGWSPIARRDLSESQRDLRCK